MQFNPVYKLLPHQLLPAFFKLYGSEYVRKLWAPILLQNINRDFCFDSTESPSSRGNQEVSITMIAGCLLYSCFFLSSPYLSHPSNASMQEAFSPLFNRIPLSLCVCEWTWTTGAPEHHRHLSASVKRIDRLSRRVLERLDGSGRVLSIAAQ